MGVVVDEKQNYIWKRARKNIQMPFEVQPSDADAEASAAAKCVSAILRHEGIEVSAGELLDRGDTPQEILESLLSDRKVICVDLILCKLRHAGTGSGGSTGGDAGDRV